MSNSFAGNASFVGGAGSVVKRFSTPQLLKIALAGIWLLTLMFWGSARGLLAETRHYVQTVGKDSVPSIVAAEGIRARFANANACAIKAELDSETGADKWWKRCDDDIADATDLLVTAAQNITYGDEERAPILKIAQTLPRYTAAIGVARSLSAAERVSKTVAASNLMRSEILPAAEQLDAANFKHLDQEYAASVKSFGFDFFLEILAISILMAGLLWAQFFLFGRFRRVVNPLLFAAMLASCVAATWTLSAVWSAESSLKVAKKDAFDSIHALWKTRAIAFDANADEALWLLDLDGQNHGPDFNAKAALLANVPISDAILQEAKKGSGVRFSGFLADELNNITFDGELEAASNALDAWRKYRDVDALIRTQERAKQHSKAVQLSVGTQIGSSSQALDAFDKSLTAVININQKQFDAKISEAFATLDGLNYWLPILSLASLLCATLGINRRLREYA